jgi:hypothetical protein
MTTISASRSGIAVTPFEGMLLRAASELEHFVSSRLELRGGAAYRRAAETRAAGEAARGAAQARGAIGMIPR